MPPSPTKDERRSDKLAKGNSLSESKKDEAQEPPLTSRGAKKKKDPETDICEASLTSRGKRKKELDPEAARSAAESPLVQRNDHNRDLAEGPSAPTSSRCEKPLDTSPRKTPLQEEATAPEASLSNGRRKSFSTTKTSSQEEMLPPDLLLSSGRRKSGATTTFAITDSEGQLTSRGRKSLLAEATDLPTSPRGCRKSDAIYPPSDAVPSDPPSPQQSSRKPRKVSSLQDAAIEPFAKLSATPIVAPSLQPCLSAMTVRTKLKMRVGAELDSNQAGEVRAGTRVHVLEKKTLPDGTARSCLALEGQSTILGWVSSFAKDGQENLLANESIGLGASASAISQTISQKNSSAFAPNALPSMSSSSPLDNTLVVPGYSSLPTARSSAKATAAVGVAKSSLPPAAIAAAEAAARASVAAQAAAVKEAAEAARSGRPPPVRPSTAPMSAASAIAAATPSPTPKQPSSPSSTTPKSNLSLGSSFHANSPKGVMSARGSSPRSSPRVSPSTPSTPGRTPGTPGRSTTPRTPGRGVSLGQPRRNETQRSHPSQSR